MEQQPMNKDNYRLLGIGETISPNDVYEVDGELIPVESYAIGQIIDGDEFISILRPNGGDLISRICQEYDIQTPIGKDALKIMLENAALLDRKNRDYSKENIAAFGEFGVLVRANDKICRLKNLLFAMDAPKNESIEDSWVDLGCYSVIGIMLRRNLWR